MKQKLIDLILNSPFFIFLDISKWQVWFDLDRALAEYILKIVDGVMIRAGHGKTIDVKVEEFKTELEEHPHVLRGVYWYFVSWVPWTIQYNLFVGVIRLFDFDWLCLDVEEYNHDSAVAASYSASGISFLRRLETEFPTKRIMVYSRKDVYERLRQFSSEWDSYDYIHAQYWWSNWNTITQGFIDFWTKVFMFNSVKANLPASRVNLPRPKIAQQVGDRTNLGLDFGVGSANVDVNISHEKYDDFVAYIGEPARWSGEVPEDPLPEDDGVDWAQTVALFEKAEQMVGVDNVTLSIDLVEDWGPPPTLPPDDGISYLRVIANNVGKARANLFHDRNKNGQGKPIWTMEVEPRVQFENGSEVFIINVPVVGDSAKVAFKVKDTELFILEDDFYIP